MTTEKHLESNICMHLKHFIATLSHDPISRALRCLLEAVYFALSKGEKHERLVKRIRGERSRKPSSTSLLSVKTAQANINEIKRLRRFYNNKPIIPGAKKLAHYHSDILTLNHAGASLREIKFWLFSHKKLMVSHHSIGRYLKAILNHENTQI